MKTSNAGPLHREATLKLWRYLATQEIPNVENARAYWEQSQWDPDAKAWRETLKTIEWESSQVARGTAAIQEWRRKHPVQTLALRTGLKKPCTPYTPSPGTNLCRCH